MNEKVSLHDLISFLAEKAGISKKEAELFLKEYFGAISDELLQDGFVKIKGLGSFKLTQVDERESIDVNLGTRVIVPAHDKINYIPDVQLAREVNEPFSIFEPVELDESISEEESELTTAMILSTENDDDLEDDSEDAEEPEMLSEQELTDTRIEEEDEQEGEQEEKGPCEKKNKKIIVKVVWLILFILLSGGIVFYIQNGERFCNKSV
ncbi:MAG: HU family DNA-binding protein, partial [Dysgonamonadaceae bacterium]|nr:HU family DNA-binding protein [Dysgonamonadaceae bacterium]